MFAKNVSQMLMGVALGVGHGPQESSAPVLPAPPGQADAPIENVVRELAQSRTQKVYSELNAMGLATGPGMFAEKPILISGSPALVLIVADRHTQEDNQKVLKCIESLRAKFDVKTIFCEGLAGDPAQDEAAREKVKEFYAKADSKVLSVAEKASIGVIDLPVEGGYSASESDPKPKNFERTLGTEAKSAEQQYYFGLTISPHLAAEYACSKLSKGENVIISVGGKYVSDLWARAMLAEPILRGKYGQKYPMLELNEGTLSATPDGIEHDIQILQPEDLPRVADYMRQLNKFWAAHNVGERNYQAGANVQDFFLEHAQGEDVVIVRMGTAHLFSSPKSPPALQQILAEKGVSSAMVLPFSFRPGVDADSGIITELK